MLSMGQLAVFVKVKTQTCEQSPSTVIQHEGKTEFQTNPIYHHPSCPCSCPMKHVLHLAEGQSWRAPPGKGPFIPLPRGKHPLSHWGYSDLSQQLLELLRVDPGMQIEFGQEDKVLAKLLLKIPPQLQHTLPPQSLSHSSPSLFHPPTV